MISMKFLSGQNQDPPEYEYVSTNFTGKINLENHLGIDYEPSEELELHEED